MPYQERTSVQPVSDDELKLFDPKNKTFMIHYPGLMVLVLAATGVAVFFAIGFLGYPTDPANFYLVSHPVWMPFLWLCVMLFILQASIFRHKEVVGSRWKAMAVTTVSIAIVAIVYARPEILRIVLDRLVAQLNTWGLSVERGRLLWNLADFGFIALYVGDRIYLWITHQRTRYQGPITIFGKIPPPERTDPDLSAWELVSQDIFAGAALCFILGALFQVTFFNWLATETFGGHFDACAVSWMVGGCHLGSLHNPPTLMFLDWLLAAFAVAGSAIILGIVLISRTFVLLQEKGAKEVGYAMLRALQAVFNPLDVFIRDLRNVIWPALILIGIIGAAASARFMLLYLHLLSDRQTCNGVTTCHDLSEFGYYLSNSLDSRHFQSHIPELMVIFLTLAISGAVIAALAITISAAFLLLKVHLLPNWLRFLAGVVGRVSLAFWVPSLGLSALMVGLQQAGLSQRAPFPQPGISTTLSFLYLVAVIIYGRGLKRPRQGIA